MAQFDPDQYLQEKSSAPSAAFDPDSYLAQKGGVSDQDEGFLSKAGHALGTVAKAIDSVTGAPTRAAIYAAQNGKPAMDAAWNQFGNMTDEAPSGKDIATKAGLSPDAGPSAQKVSDLSDSSVGPASDRMAMMKLGSQMTPAGIAGVAIDQAANPLNAVGPGLNVAGKAAESLAPLAETLHEFATDRAIKAAGAMKKDFNLIHDKGMQDALGNFLLDNKIVTPLATVSKVADRLQEAKQAAGETVGSILDASDAANAPRISAKGIADKLAQDPEIMRLAKTPGSEGTAKHIGNFIETLGNNGDSLTLREAQQLRQGIDKSINYNKANMDMKGAQPYLYKMRDALSTEMNNAVNALPNGGDADRLKAANAAYSKLATLDKIAQNRLGALSSNEKLSLGDKIAGGAGMVLGHDPVTKAVIGAVSAGANKTARAVGNSMAATGSNVASKLISAAPEALSATPLAAGPVSSIANQGVLSMPNVISRAAANPAPTPAPAPVANPFQQNPMPQVMPNQPPQQASPMPPSKGPDKWAHDGFQNLKGHVDDDDRKMLEENKTALLADPKSKQLLMTASTYEPGSKPLDQIVQHLKNRLGEGKK